MEDPDFKRPNNETSDQPDLHAGPDLPTAKPKPAAETAESRFGRLMRATTRFLALVLGLLAVGFLAAYFLLYRPLQIQESANRQDLEQSSSFLSMIQAERDRLLNENTRLQADLDATQAQILLLRAQKDVNLARAELANRNTTTASQALENIAATLKDLTPLVPAEKASQVRSIETRLALVQDEIGSDARTAASDLQILYNQLAELDASLVGS